MKIVTVAAAAVILGIVGCSSIAKTSTPAHTAPTPAHTAPAASVGSKAAPSPTNSLSGPVGTSYTVTDQSGNKMTVALTQVIASTASAQEKVLSAPSHSRCQLR